MPIKYIKPTVIGKPKPFAPVLLILLFTFHFSLFNSASAQRIHAFFSSGATLSQIEGDELKGFRQVGYSGGVGALASISSNNQWGISIEALFSQRGCYNRTGDPYSISLHLNYIDIPLLLHFQDPYGGMLIGAGLNYGRLVQQPHGIIKYNPDYFIPDTTDMTFLKDDLLVVGDMRFTIWRGLQFNVRWQYSLLAIKRDWAFYSYNGVDEDGVVRFSMHTRNCYNHSLTFRLIWQF